MRHQPALGGQRLVPGLVLRTAELPAMVDGLAHVGRQLGLHEGAHLLAEVGEFGGVEHGVGGLG